MSLYDAGSFEYRTLEELADEIDEATDKIGALEFAQFDPHVDEALEHLDCIRHELVRRAAER